MGKSQETFNKKEKEKKRLKKRKEKLEKKEERKAQGKRSLDDMISYVDENGQFSDTPPDPSKKVAIDVESITLGATIREDIEEDPIKRGKIEFFNTEKGFGFIKEDETNEKFFVHVHGLIDEVTENDKVQFELEQGLKGLNAVRVKIIKTPPPAPKVIPPVTKETTPTDKTPTEETPKDETPPKTDPV